eukprot:15346679-Alexandrium_andersonii.AAC.1
MPNLGERQTYCDQHSTAGGSLSLPKTPRCMLFFLALRSSRYLQPVAELARSSIVPKTGERR